MSASSICSYATGAAGFFFCSFARASAPAENDAAVNIHVVLHDDFFADDDAHRMNEHDVLADAGAGVNVGTRAGNVDPSDQRREKGDPRPVQPVGQTMKDHRLNAGIEQHQSYALRQAALGSARFLYIAAI